MTGYDVIKRAMHLLGYSGQEGDPSESQGTAEKDLEIINQLLPDLNCGGILSLSDFLETTNKNHLFAEMYNAKRATALAQISGVTDTLPQVTAG